MRLLTPKPKKFYSFTPVWGKAGGGGATDPDFASVKLLLGFEGADASTGAPGMTDQSPSARGNATVTATAQIDTAQFKMGASSLLLASGDKISFPDSSDWELSGQFTIELFLRPATFPIASTIIGHGVSSSTYGWWLNYTNGGTVNFQFDTNGDGTPDHSITQGTTFMVANTWYHVCIERDGSNKLRLYVDGVMRASKVSATGTSFNSAGTLDIGMMGASTRPMVGWIDELRITKGVARYASDSGFTVPTTPYPRS